MQGNKKEMLDSLLLELGKCQRCLCLQKKNGKDCSLINIYQDFNFCRKIPSIWTDWYHRLDADIMIIGQDWGPYDEMKKFHNQYMEKETEENWNRVLESEKSLTKRLLEKYLVESMHEALEDDSRFTLDQFYITNAILCARKGSHYRGDNIKLKESTFFCSTYLKRQIEIIQPKVILTLGYYPLLSLSHIFNFEIADTLTKTIEEKPEIQIENYRIIPLYHPTAQMKKEQQLAQYRRIWNIE